jgi:hypothetical protein
MSKPKRTVTIDKPDRLVSLKEYKPNSEPKHISEVIDQALENLLK